MFDTTWIADLDAASACEAVLATQTELREREWHELSLAAHWATLHGEETLPQRIGPLLPGTERARQIGGEGTPLVAEFACAELGLLMGTSAGAADSLLRDALDLQHRHPRMWEVLGSGAGRVWKARKVARLVHTAGLTREQAHLVDAATTPYVDSLPWGRFVQLVEARIIEADPDAAEARRVTAELGRFVMTGQSNEFGLKTLIARAQAGEIIYLVAMCDRLADILLAEGDDDPVDARRSKALGLLAHPARALSMLQRHAACDPDQPHDQRSDQPPETCAACGALGGAAGSPQPFPIDPDRLRPHAVLHVRISEETLRSARGVGVCETGGVGVITAEQVIAFLGHSHVSVRPVVDTRSQLPVDSYEIPTEMREALRLSRPSSVFPWSHSAARESDADHSRRFVPLEAGGPRWQTRLGNLGPLARFGHRVKTHGRGWRHRQPVPGVYLWRTPHGYWFRTDREGTHPLGRDPDLTPHHPTPTQHPARTPPRRPHHQLSTADEGCARASSRASRRPRCRGW